MNKTQIFFSLSAAALISLTACQSDSDSVENLPSAEQELVNVSGASGIALSGYDPVAFFTQNKAVHGDPEITATHEGVQYMFSSRDHKKLFTEDPDKYKPQYGGFSALGVTFGSLLPVDINTWKVKDGKLYLHLNPEYAEEFYDDFEENVKTADQKWPEIVEKNRRLE